MDSHDDLPDHPEDPFQAEAADEAAAAPPPAADAAEAAAPVDEDAEDFVDDENEEDDEATLDEEEGLLEDDEDELDDLEAEADMDIEELRRKYGYGAPAAGEAEASASHVVDDEDEDVDVETVDPTEAETVEAIETAANDYFGVGTGEAAETIEEEEEDGDYEPPEKKEFMIRVDPLMYQAEVPDTIAEGGDETTEHAQGILLWSPKEDLTSSALNRFVHEWTARKAGVETDESKMDSRDDEDALYALLHAAYSTVDAAAAFPGLPANRCERTIKGEPRKFTPDEMTSFETGFRENYKNFRVIREKFVPERTMGELINYYYHWKRTARYNEFRRTSAMQRKDFMTEVMDQMDGHSAAKRRRVEATTTTSSDSHHGGEASAPPAADHSHQLHTTIASRAAATVSLKEDEREEEIEFEDPMNASSGDDLPADLWASTHPLPPAQEQPTESA